MYEDFKNNTRLPSHIHMNDDIEDAKCVKFYVTNPYKNSGLKSIMHTFVKADY